MSDDHDIIDTLLHALVDKGEGSFDVFNELLYLKGPDYANRMYVFYERSLEYHKLVNRNHHQKSQFTLTSLGKEVSKKGGWNKYLIWKEEQARLEYEKTDRLEYEKTDRFEIERADRLEREKNNRLKELFRKHRERLDLSTKEKNDFTMTLSVIAVIFAFIALVCSVAALNQ